MERKQSLAFGAALVTGVFWASAFVGIRSAGESLSPGALALARLAIGSAERGRAAPRRGHGGNARQHRAGVIGIATSQQGLSTAGTLLALLAAFAYAGGVVIQKVVLRRVSALQTTFLCCCVGAVICLPFAPALVREAGDAEGSALAWAVYLGVFPTGLAFTTWAYALARTTAGRLAATTYLVPPISILLGWAILGESPPALAFLGGALCLVGVALSRRGPRTAKMSSR